MVEGKWLRILRMPPKVLLRFQLTGRDGDGGRKTVKLRIIHYEQGKARDEEGIKTQS